MLKIENLTSGYGKKQVLSNVSLNIKQGEIALLIGSNGSGKSTLLKSIYGIIQSFHDKAGKIWFNQQDITHCKSSSLLYKGLSYVPQRNNCFEDLTVKENLEISGNALQSSIPFRDRYSSVLSRFSTLKNISNKKVNCLSGGEKQITAIAMAVLHEPLMILLDEPLAGLSEYHVRSIKDIIGTLNSELNITFLIAEHKISDIQELVNQLIGLKLGTICDTSDLSKVFI